MTAVLGKILEPVSGDSEAGLGISNCITLIENR